MLARANLRKDLEKAGLSALAADLLANLFESQDNQFAVLAGAQFDGVVGAYGIAAHPKTQTGVVISKGMLVRTSPNALIPASSESGDAHVWANAFVMGEAGGLIYTAQGAERAPLLVKEPVAGQKVSVLRRGMGTCSTIAGSNDLQPVATCEVSTASTADLCMCSMIAFQTSLNQSLGTRYWATDGSSSPSTGPWQLGGSALANLNFWQTVLFGGNPYAGGWYQAQGGLDSLADLIVGGTGDPDDDSTFDFSNTSLFANGNWISSGNATASDYIAMTMEAPTEARVVTRADASGTIQLIVDATVNPGNPYEYDVAENTLNRNGDCITEDFYATLVAGESLDLRIDYAATTPAITYVVVGSDTARIQVTVMRITSTSLRCCMTVWENGQPAVVLTGTKTVTDLDANAHEIEVSGVDHTFLTVITRLNKVAVP